LELSISKPGQIIWQNTPNKHVLMYESHVVTQNMEKKKVYNVKPGATGLLTGVEYSRVKDSICHVSYPLVITRLGVELVDIQGKLFDSARVGL